MVRKKSVTDILVENVKNSVDIINVIPENVKDKVEDEVKKEKKLKAIEARKRTIALKKIKELEAKILLNLVPDNIETDDEFPLFFPISKSKKKIKVIASNSLFEFNNKIKKFMSNLNDEEYFYSNEFSFIDERYNRFKYLYNNNKLTFLHLGAENELKVLYEGIDDELIEIMKQLIPELNWELIKNNLYDDTHSIEGISKIMKKLKIKNNIEIKNTPKHYKVFWKN